MKQKLVEFFEPVAIPPDHANFGVVTLPCGRHRGTFNHYDDDVHTQMQSWMCPAAISLKTSIDAR